MPETRKGGFHALEERIHQLHDEPEKATERKSAPETEKPAQRGEPKERPASTKR